MITFLEGKLYKKAPTRIEVNVGGIGYEVFIPLSSYDRLPAPGKNLHILTHDHIREDVHFLYGFMTEGERMLFLRLLSISGIGPKIALSALSGMSVRDISASIVNGDVKRLSSISGIGKKMAERMIVELRDKMSAGEALEALAGEEQSNDLRVQDSVLALMALGYKQMDAWKMARKVIPELPEDATVETIVKHALMS